MAKKDEDLFVMPPKPDFKEVIRALLNHDAPFPPRFLHQFSDISAENLDELKKIWLQIADQRRETLLEDLEDLVDSDTLLSFEDIGHFALSDPLPTVRITALHLLWESLDTRLVPVLMDTLRKDPDYRVRAAAASNLGTFVYYGELEKISASLLHRVEDVLLETLNGTDHLEVRRRALEAMGYSSREEIGEQIEKAYQESDRRWLMSALFAMGRSANERWEEKVAANLDHSDPAVQLEAVRAAGELNMKSYRKDILELLEDENLDSDVWEAAVWSLSQIGGKNVRERLEELAENTDDDEELEILENALDNLSFTEDMDHFDLLDIEDANHSYRDEEEFDPDEGEPKKPKKFGDLYL